MDWKSEVARGHTVDMGLAVVIVVVMVVVIKLVRGFGAV